MQFRYCSFITWQYVYFNERIDNLLLVSKDTFLVTSPNGGSLDVYKFDDPATNEQFPTSKQRFHLPTLVSTSCYIPDMRASAYALRSDMGATNPVSPSYNMPLFSPAPEAQIYDIGVVVFDDILQRVITQDTLLVHSRVFVQSANGGLSVPWGAWGPRNSRWFHETHPHWYKSYGLKVIGLCDEPGDQLRNISGRKLRLLDFNPYATTSLDDSTKYPIVTGPSTMVGVLEHSRFTQDVVTYLPYREVEIEERFDLTELMMDGDQIVVKKVMLILFYFIFTYVLIFTICDFSWDKTVSMTL